MKIRNLIATIIVFLFVLLLIIVGFLYYQKSNFNYLIRAANYPDTEPKKFLCWYDNTHGKEDGEYRKKGCENWCNKNKRSLQDICKIESINDSSKTAWIERANNCRNSYNNCRYIGHGTTYGNDYSATEFAIACIKGNSVCTNFGSGSCFGIHYKNIGAFSKKLEELIKDKTIIVKGEKIKLGFNQIFANENNTTIVDFEINASGEIKVDYEKCSVKDGDQFGKSCFAYSQQYICSQEKEGEKEMAMEICCPIDDNSEIHKYQKCLVEGDQIVCKCSKKSPYDSGLIRPDKLIDQFNKIILSLFNPCSTEIGRTCHTGYPGIHREKGDYGCIKDAPKGQFLNIHNDVIPLCCRKKDGLIMELEQKLINGEIDSFIRETEYGGNGNLTNNKDWEYGILQPISECPNYEEIPLEDVPQRQN